jgi:hypothetical protein
MTGPDVAREIHAKLARHDLGERRLAEAGRSGKEHMVERLVASLGRLDEDMQILLRLRLADEFLQHLRTQMRVELVFRAPLAVYETVGRRVHATSFCQ